MIDKEIISECANELHITGDIIDLIDNSPSPDKTTKDSDLIRKSQKQKMAVSVIAMLLLGIVGYFMYNFQLDESPQWGMEDIAKKKNLILSQEEKNALIAKISEESRAQKKESVTETRAKQTDVKNKDLSATKDTTVEKDAAHARRGIENKNVLVSGSPNITQYPGQKTVVHFKHNSNEIPDQAFESLKRIVRLASKNPESEIIVEGYTDSFGNYQYNKKLSKFRADIIKSYFAGQGIPVSRIKTYGMGPENPIATNNTFEGRKKNRRVEIRINSKE